MTNYTKGEMHMKNMYIYILTNDNKNVMYVGVTSDLIRRMYEHKNHLDEGSFTARYNVTRLVYYEYTNNPEAAIEREKQIKGWNRARKNKLVESKNPNWDEERYYEEVKLHIQAINKNHYEQDR